MTSNVTSIRPQDTVQRAAAVMRDADIGPLPVCDGNRIIGILTDRDITVRAVACSPDPTALTVGETMTEGIIYCFDDEELEFAVERMCTHEIRRLPVLDRDYHLVGILALADIARHTNDRFAASAVKGVSRPG
jgi:CBS domain-containing protein